MNRLHALAAAFVVVAVISPLAQADDILAPDAPLPRYNQECGACHTAYPPGLLPGASWKRNMGALDQHFGADATLDAASARQISAWLQANAGTYKRVREVPPQDRITLSNWFTRKHRELKPDVFRRASIKTPANCSACHGAADKGDFDEHRVRIPK